MDVRTVSIKIDAGGNSEIIALAGGGTATKATKVSASGDGVITPSVDCYVRSIAGVGSAASATNDGTDIKLAANNSYRYSGLKPLEALSFNGATAGNINHSPGA